MKIPIIIAAFGTTSKAIATYHQLDQALKRHFPAEEILWTYSSRKIARKLQKRDSSDTLHPEKLLQLLAAQGVKQAVVQSLHLFPGSEFHRLHHLVNHSGLHCTLGMPILTTPEDYNELGELLRPLLSTRVHQTILILGHGTDHPSWTGYYSLEKMLRRKFSRNIYVGVVEKYPHSAHLVEELANNKVARVCIIPLFLVTGMHYRRDIIGDSAESWRSRLEARNISVEVIDQGLGLYPGFERLVARHIDEARRDLICQAALLAEQENSKE